MYFQNNLKINVYNNDLCSLASLPMTGRGKMDDQHKASEKIHHTSSIM